MCSLTSYYRNKGTIKNGQTAQHRDFFFQRRAGKLQQTELGHLWEETLASIWLFILNILICSTQMPYPLSGISIQLLNVWLPTDMAAILKWSSDRAFLYYKYIYIYTI